MKHYLYGLLVIMLVGVAAPLPPAAGLEAAFKKIAARY